MSARGKRLIWIGRDLFATALEAALEAGHVCAAIYTTDGPGPTLSERLHAIGAAHGIPVHVGRVGAAACASIVGAAPDLIVVGGWPRLLPVFADHGLRAINIHPSLLPEGRGPWPLPHVILRDLPRFGVTLHQVAATFDTGPIVAQRSLAAPPWIDLDALVHLSRRLAARLLVETLADLDRAWAAATPQVGGDWWPRLTRADRTLDWTSPREAVFRVARAFGREGVFGRIAGVERLLVGIDVADGVGVPGEVLARAGDRVRVATGAGAVDFWLVEG